MDVLRRWNILYGIENQTDSIEVADRTQLAEGNTMENIQLRDGQNVIIGSNRDITEAIECRIENQFQSFRTEEQAWLRK